jgi:uncharacterized protein (TIGR03086 family)
MSADDDVLRIYLETLNWLEPRIAGTRPGQLRLPTPCTEWDVEALLSHVFTTLVSYTALAENGHLNSRPPTPGVTDEAYPGTYRSLADRGRRAWSEPGMLDRLCDSPWRGPVRGGLALSIHTTDLLLHGWDLARATGQSDRMDDDGAVFAFGVLEREFSGDRRSRYFRPALEPLRNDDNQGRLIAMSGRSAAWSPPPS